MNKKGITAGIVTVIVIAIVVALSNTSSKNNATVTPSPVASSTGSPSASMAAGTTATPDSGIMLVTFNGTSFIPSQTTVKAGNQIRFTNRSNNTVDVDSDPHPAHTSDIDLNIGSIAPGASKTVTVTQKGSFGIHDHLNPTIVAKITVE